jgi:hypothetical protein
MNNRYKVKNSNEIVVHKEVQEYMWCPLPGGVLEQIDSGFQIKWGPIGKERQKMWCLYYPDSVDPAYGMPELDELKKRAVKFIVQWTEVHDNGGEFFIATQDLIKKLKDEGDVAH